MGRSLKSSPKTNWASGAQLRQPSVGAGCICGANITYSVDCGGETIQVIEQSRRMVEIGQQVWLTIPPDRIWIINDNT